jgi:magnesium transporter
MLKAYACGGGRLSSIDAHSQAAAAPGAIWFDLLNPEPEESAFVTHETGLSLPSHEDLTEIENSSRLSADGPVLTLSMPIVTRVENSLRSSVCGFVLAPDRLVTIRFASSLVFDNFAAQPHETGAADEPQSAFVLIGLLEAIVDRQADVLEKLRSELDQLSHQVFHHRFGSEKREKALQRRNTEADLQAILVTLGRDYDTISFLRDSQLGVARIAPYVEGAAPWLPHSVAIRLKSVQKDISSLNEFSTHLTDKVQFLLDATLGLINIAQNSLIKVLTIVSIVGIPPTLVAGIYGMNFHDMPELSWTYGYGYGWAVMIISAILPLAWFRTKGWL